MSELNRLIAALSDTTAYPECTRGITVVQTQMSVVFMTDQYAYKIKKPINLGYVDYTQLEYRKHFCGREVELNRRLCPAVYLGVVAITANGDRFIVEGLGTAVEYAVKMRRLPDNMLLDKLLKQNKVTAEMMGRLAVRLSDFHQSAATGEEIVKFGTPEAIARNTEENFHQTEKYAEAISTRQFAEISHYTRHFIEQNGQLLAKRQSEGRIRDCHGDLHAQHVCFCQDLCIFDCIEFNDRFRYSDTAAEVAFLAMDLEHSGRADLARHFVTAYAAESEDDDLVALLNFYKCYRAYVRGKVNCFKLDDPYVSETDRQEALSTAQGYFELATAYTLTKLPLIIMVGFVGSGKTTVAQELSGRLGAVYLSSDITRKRLAGIPLTEHRHRQLGDGLYSAEFTRRTYDALYQEATDALAAGYPVILDAAFLKAHERVTAQQIAAHAGADFYTLECRTDADLIQSRLEKRLEQVTVSDGCWEIFLKQQEWFEPPDISAPGYLMVDTSKPLAHNVRRIMAQIIKS